MSDLLEGLARVLYAALYPDAPDAYDDPELEFERTQVRRFAQMVLNSPELARIRAELSFRAELGRQ